MFESLHHSMFYVVFQMYKLNNINDTFKITIDARILFLHLLPSPPIDWPTIGGPSSGLDVEKSISRTAASPFLCFSLLYACHGGVMREGGGATMQAHSAPAEHFFASRLPF